MSRQARETLLLQVLRQNAESSDESLSKTTGWSLRTVQRTIYQLRESKTIKISRTRFQLGSNWVNQRRIEVCQF